MVNTAAKLCVAAVTTETRPKPPHSTLPFTIHCIVTATNIPSALVPQAKGSLDFSHKATSTFPCPMPEQIITSHTHYITHWLTHYPLSTEGRKLGTAASYAKDVYHLGKAILCMPTN